MTITPFKVIQGHRCRYQSKARMRLLFVKYPISYRFEVIADYCSNSGRKQSLCFFEPLSATGLGTVCDARVCRAFRVLMRLVHSTVTVHLRLIGKLVVEFLFVLV